MNSYNLESNREWWAQQWIDLLETSPFKKRLERARNYARQGNVLNLDFQGAKVLAKVQGTDPKPYELTISLDEFSAEDWAYIVEIMSQKAIISAQLLAGQMPDKIQDVFSASGLSLFPFRLSEVHSQCSCPDPKVPCKHIGAVYYLLGDRFSEDPFVLFQLRGRTKDKIIEDLHNLRRQNLNSELNISQVTNLELSLDRPTSKVEKPSLQTYKFWEYEQPLDPNLAVIAPTTSGNSLLDLLGNIPLKGEVINDNNTPENLTNFLNNVYQNVSQQAIIAALQRR
ncbi:SWIM zinc finger family protein [Merismopedia glauca]|uniref:SWIM-type domain-containing protein n=1 Tax=Merismopedia glauca CCAP 1448/3 TaxID=1296344 RepID=A0A2T1BYQ4_9CYAN|nr:SWIM zinc finger family protein [Merismopedia glauca]PSB01074.1 hypothetical protein C7B64_20220 [Merismopedia glauca CCAP 1448/3]